MKKIIGLLIATALVVGLSSCSNSLVGAESSTSGIEVSVDLGGSSARAIGDAVAVNVKAVTSAGVRIATADLANVGGTWKGSLAIPIGSYGTVKFIASASKTGGGIVAHGEVSQPVDGSTTSVTITTTGYSGTISKSYDASALDIFSAGAITTPTTYLADLLLTDGGSKIAVDANSKTATVNGASFSGTKRLKFGGAGSSTAVNGSIPVTGPCILTLAAVTGNATTGLNRHIGVYSSASSSEIYEAYDFATGSDIEVYNVPYTGGAGNLIFYSKSSGINFYYITVTYQ